MRRQDIAPASETVTVELRDAATGRVVERIALARGRDYQINVLQGMITLTDPLNGPLDRRLVQTTLTGDETVNLVVQYEYTPTTSDVQFNRWRFGLWF